MRVIAGELKGRRLQTPSWPGLRPTSDMLRETLFNVLGPRVVGARLLDGYAGTGAVGIEALSRGAAHVTFVERDSRAIRLLEANLQRCGISNRYAIIRAGFAETARRLNDAFDIIFIDPPYGRSELTGALDAASALVSLGTTLVAEHARRDSAPDRQSGLVRMRELISGDSALSFFVKS